MKSIPVLFLAFALATNGAAQSKINDHYSYFSSGLKQIKESANFGLVFNGPNLIYGHYWSSIKNNKTFFLENEIGVCIPFSKGIPALNIHLKPVETGYLFNRKSATNNFAIGPFFKIDYDYTLYPQLQSAFDYWFTNFSLGVNAAYDFIIGKQTLNTRLKSSLLGFTSRQPDYRNPYWYDIGFKHAIKHLNSDLEFSTLNKYNTTDFELSWKTNPDSRITWAYCFNYSGYYAAPPLSTIYHNIKLIINP